jgi:TatD DNase family protein
MLEAYLPETSGTAVLQWFTGNPSEARRAVQLGCYFSINAEMLKSEQKRNLVGALPHERLLTETDGPFTMTDGRPSIPDDVTTTLSSLAVLLKMDVEEVKSLIGLNFQRLESQH